MIQFQQWARVVDYPKLLNAHAHHCLLFMLLPMPISPKAVVKVDNSFLLSVASLWSIVYGTAPTVCLQPLYHTYLYTQAFGVHNGRLFVGFYSACQCHLPAQSFNHRGQKRCLFIYLLSDSSQRDTALVRSKLTLTRSSTPHSLSFVNNSS